jgi:hypothetical protein
MNVRIEGAESGYKGPTLFIEDQTVSHISLPAQELPENLITTGLSAYLHRFRGGLQLYVVDMNLQVKGESLLVTGVAANRNAAAPPQIILAEHFQGRKVPAIVRFDNSRFDASLVVAELKQKGPQLSKDVEFVRKHYVNGI